MAGQEEEKASGQRVESDSHGRVEPTELLGVDAQLAERICVSSRRIESANEAMLMVSVLRLRNPYGNPTQHDSRLAIRHLVQRLGQPRSKSRDPST